MPRGMMSAPTVEKGAKNVKKSLFSLAKFSKRYGVFVVCALILAVAGTVFTILGPNKIGDMTNLIQEGLFSPSGIDIAAIAKIGVFLTVIYGLSLVFSYTQGFIMSTVTQRLSKDMRTSISIKINKMPLKYFDKTSYGDVLSRVTNDVDTIGQTLNQSVVTLVTSITMLIGVMIMMFTINWILALTAIGSTIVGFAIMVVIMTRSQKYFFRQQNALGEINGHIEETYSGHNVIKAFNAEPETLSVFGKINQKLYNSAWKSQFMSGMMMPLMGFIGNFGFVSVCVVGGALAIDGKIPFGDIVSFMIYVRLFSNPLSQLAQVMTALQSTAAASERVFDFLQEEELSAENAITKRLETVKGEVEFEHVRFGYDPSRVIIKDFSAKIAPGNKVAIVGPTGAGKTTLVNLLMKFYETNGGEIRLDGVPIRELTRENVHALFGMVLQDTWMFEGTVRDNIVYSKKGVTEEEVQKACKAAGLDHYIRTLPHGYDTVLDDKTNISAGQKQLITIARAMIENAPMLILDEATSSVDTRTELIIQSAMDTLTEGRTSFVIAHRLSTIKNSDVIFVMKDGDIVESGDHETLLGKNGFYADLYNSQFASE